MNCIYPSPLLRYLGEGRIRLVLPANYAIKECRKTPPCRVPWHYGVFCTVKQGEKLLFNPLPLCFRRNIGGVPVGREGVNSTIEKSYVIFFNPSPQKLSFLRCLSYTTSQHPVMLRDTAGEKGGIHLTLLCVLLSNKIQRRCPADGGVNPYSPKTYETFSTPLHRNCRYFGVSPILLTQYPVAL